MRITSRLAKVLLCIIALSAMSACGDFLSSSSPSSPSQPVVQSGKITQGPISGATIYADSYDSGTRFVLDAGEVNTTTDASGNFSLITPAYKHLLVSTGGIDTLTGNKALDMIAPAGSKNVTPLTTLVALDTTGTVQAKIESLLPAGAKFDADISTVTSPAALLLVQSIQVAVQAITAAVDSGAAISISAAQLSSIQTEVMQSITQALASVPPASFVATISTPNTLSTTMQSAASVALTALDNQPNITISPAGVTAAAASVVTAVTSTATAMSLPLTSTASNTQIVGGEAAVITPAVATGITAAATVAATAIDSNVTSTSTPPTYVPPPVVVVVPEPPTITGSGGGTGF